jgi:Mce-associated membrane protein
VALWRVADGQRDTEAGGQDALAAARRAAVALLSYDSRTVDTQLATASDLITGPFQADFRTVTSTQVAPAAKERQVSTHAQVVAAAVVTAAPREVTTLLYLNQITESASSPAPTISGSRVRLTMTEVAGRWLVSAMTPA